MDETIANLSLAEIASTLSDREQEVLLASIQIAVKYIQQLQAEEKQINAEAGSIQNDYKTNADAGSLNNDDDDINDADDDDVSHHNHDFNNVHHRHVNNNSIHHHSGQLTGNLVGNHNDVDDDVDDVDEDDDEADDQDIDDDDDIDNHVDSKHHINIHLANNTNNNRATNQRLHQNNNNHHNNSRQAHHRTQQHNNSNHHQHNLHHSQQHQSQTTSLPPVAESDTLLIKSFSEELKDRRKRIRLSQKGAAQSLRAFTNGIQPCTDAIIYHYENLQLEPERALQLIPLLRDWLEWAEDLRNSGKQLPMMSAVTKLPRERKRKVVLFNERAKEHLENAFSKNNHPDRYQLDVISEELDIPTRSIRKWFTNRRQRKRFAEKFSDIPQQYK